MPHSLILHRAKIKSSQSTGEMKKSARKTKPVENSCSENYFKKFER
jgi:hypothetical protein